MLRSAIAFFTTLPVGTSPFSNSFRGILVWFPLVGLLIGVLTALVVYGASLFLPPVLCGLLGCLVWAGLTGGLHLDGVADCGDGLLVETTPARRLEIMRDSRLGAFGGITLFFTLALKAGTLIALTGHSLPELLGALGLAGVLSRSLVLIAIRQPSARPDGLGHSQREGIERRHELLILTGTLCLALVNGPRGICALLAALAVNWLLLRTARARLGGVTGDVFGCLVETTEWVVLLVFCIQGAS